MLTRDDRQIALNRVNELLRLTADQLEQAAQRVKDEPTAAWLRTLAADRLHVAKGLDAYLLEHGELPTRPDPDRELVVNMLAGMRDALRGEAAVPDLHLHSEWESRLDEAIRHAQELAGDEQAQAVLGAARAHLEQARLGPPAGESGAAAAVRDHRPGV